MTKTYTATIPGKLMLAGEYAVLAGGTALLCCVDRYCEASLSPLTEGPHRLTTMGFAPGEYTFRLDENARVVFDDPKSASLLRLPQSVLEELPPRKPVHITLDSTEFYDGERKLGLGSSAAVCVAMAEVLARFNGDPAARRGALNAHSAYQNGSGSGADIYTVSKGNVVAFTRTQRGAKIEALKWPEGLFAAVFLMPESAATVAHVKRFNAWRDRDESAQALVAQAANEAGGVVEMWRQGDPAAIIEALQAWTDRMFEIDQQSGVGYSAGGHRPMHSLANKSGVLYKPCGAGGGDVGIAFTTQQPLLDNFIEKAQDLGVAVLPLSLKGVVPAVR